MSQSLYTSMGGIAAATTELSVISNNVANINTTAYKSSSVQFADVYYSTLSYGSVATGAQGGTNPIQIGVGVEVSAISTNFSTGSWVATGSNTDLMINGPGFFTVQASDGSTFYTRAGDFSIDEDGNLVTSDGYKVLGTSSTLSSSSSGDTVQIPTSITATVGGNASLASESMAELNGIDNTITQGYFTITDSSVPTAVANTSVASSPVVSLNGVNNAITAGTFMVGATLVTLDPTVVSGTSTVTNLMAAINTSLSATDITASIDPVTARMVFTDASGDPLTFTAGTSNFLATTGVTDGASPRSTNTLSFVPSTVTYNITLDAADVSGTVGGLVSAINTDLTTQGSTVVASINPMTGQIEFNQPSGHTLSFATPSTDLTVGGVVYHPSNFVAQAEITGSVGDYATKTLDWTVYVTDLSTATESTSANSTTINNDGSLEVTYKDGSTLSVQLNTSNQYEFIYTSSDAIKISGDDCVVSSDVAEPGNFVIQMATITNTEGLLAVGSNLYEAGPNTGDVIYTVAGEMGCGEVQSGGLEASNVDLSDELANMILAQRAIQANSRVFSTTSEVMDVITNMGR